MTERYCSHAQRNARAEARRRLKAEYGVTLTPYHQTTREIAQEIQKIEPALGGDPMMVIHAWLNENPRSVATSRQVVIPKQSYSPSRDRALTANLARLAGIPKPVSMSSRAKGNWPEDFA